MPKLGYHPATWRWDGDLDRLWQALGDIAAAGWDGFEFAGAGLESYYSRPDLFAGRLRDLGLAMSAMYVGSSFADEEAIARETETVRQAADFGAAIGCGVVLIDGGTKLQGDHHGEPDYRRVAAAANRMGEIIGERGLTCAWHQHWGTLFEFPPACHRLMALTDPERVRFCPDTAQLTLGLFPLKEVFAEYLDRIAYVHFKDLGADRRFIECGCGGVNFAELWDILEGAGYDGWVVVDLDYTLLDPCESSAQNLRYLCELGLR